MRKALLTTVLLLVGCSSKQIPSGAIKVELSVNDFAPGCVVVSAQDSASHHAEATLSSLARGDQKVLALEGPWGAGLNVTATAFETTCGDHQVATATAPASVPKTGVGSLSLALSAPDLDQDGFVDQVAGGSDCNDSADSGVHFHPGVAELCNGLDDNCDGAADEGLPTHTYYRDDDLDGYGQTSKTSTGCGSPGIGWAVKKDDCNDDPDGGATVHPGIAETCNGVDDDCNQQIDDGLDVSASCNSTGGCPGTLACHGAAGIQCEAPDAYADWDHDGHGAGSALSVCTDVPTSALDDDCDDANAATFPGAPDVCDQRDNSCGVNGVDDSCPGAMWKDDSPAEATADWNAASAYGVGDVWFAGDGDKVLLHTSTGFADPRVGCAAALSGNWKASWVDGSGTVYLGGEVSATANTGQVVTVTPSGVCAGTGIVGTSDIVQGVVRVPAAGGATNLYAATKDGKVYSNIVANFVSVDTTGPLNGIHGIAPDRVIAVGSEKIGPKFFPAAYLRNLDGTWKNLDVHGTVPGVAEGALFGVYVLDASTAYMVGDNGLVLMWNGTVLTKLDSPNSGAHLTTVTAFDRATVYVAGWNGTIYRWNGTAWQTLNTPALPHSLFAITGTNTEDLWVSGFSNLIAHWHEP